MANFKYYLKDPNTDGETAIYLSIHNCGKRVKYYIGKSIAPCNWKNEKAIKIKTAPEFNAVLSKIKNEAEIIANRLKAENMHEPTPNEIKSGLDLMFSPAPEVIKLDLIEFFQKTAKDISNRYNDRTKKPLSPATKKMYQQTLNVLLKFQTAKRKKLTFESIDLDFYSDFKNFMEQNLCYSANTVGKHIKQLKTVLNEATDLGLNTNMRYRSKRFQAFSEMVNNIFLTEQELQEMANLDLTDSPRLDRVRDLFLIGSWTGLRFSDFTRVGAKNLEIDSDGSINIKIKTQKTGETIKAPVLPQIEHLIEKYGGIENFSLPNKISNQKMNEYLKEIGQLMDSMLVTFDKERTKGGALVSVKRAKWGYLTTHTARRSFATNMFKRGNIPVQFDLAKFLSPQHLNEQRRD